MATPTLNKVFRHIFLNGRKNDIFIDVKLNCRVGQVKSGHSVCTPILVWTSNPHVKVRLAAIRDNVKVFTVHNLRHENTKFYRWIGGAAWTSATPVSRLCFLPILRTRQNTNSQIDVDKIGQLVSPALPFLCLTLYAYARDTRFPICSLSITEWMDPSVCVDS